MGRKTATPGIPNYRDVLVANAVRALRGHLPDRPGFAAGHRTWLATAGVEDGWRSVAVAAGAIPASPALR